MLIIAFNPFKPQTVLITSNSGSIQNGTRTIQPNIPIVEFTSPLDNFTYNSQTPQSVVSPSLITDR